VEKIKDWNPELYLKFGNERTQPSIDLVHRINLNHEPWSIIDIGCGPGNSGQVLFARWPNAHFTGIDSSAAMIAKARSDFPNKNWVIADAACYASEEKFDIVFSNATIQWIPNHEGLIDRCIDLLAKNGALAIQLPKFRDMPIGQIIEEKANSARWAKKMHACADLFTFHDYNFYYDLFSKRLDAVEMWETYYLHILDSHRSIIEWTKSTGMKPYLDRLNTDAEKAEFEDEIVREIEKRYPLQANRRVIFPFKRLFMIGYNHS
jgi:trans-aconitate 2-methyltransferase